MHFVAFLSFSSLMHLLVPTYYTVSTRAPVSWAKVHATIGLPRLRHFVQDPIQYSLLRNSGPTQHELVHGTRTTTRTAPDESCLGCSAATSRAPPPA